MDGWNHRLVMTGHATQVSSPHYTSIMQQDDIFGTKRHGMDIGPYPKPADWTASEYDRASRALGRVRLVCRVNIPQMLIVRGERPDCVARWDTTVVSDADDLHEVMEAFDRLEHGKWSTDRVIEDRPGVMRKVLAHLVSPGASDAEAKRLARVGYHMAAAALAVIRAQKLAWRRDAYVRMTELAVQLEECATTATA